MASREQQEFSSQAPAPQVSEILSGGVFPAAGGLLQRGLTDPNIPDSNPYSYTGQRIADFDPRESRAFNLTDQAIGSYIPFLQAGTDVLGQGADAYRSGIGQRFDPTSTDEFFNPFLDRVAGRVEDRAERFIKDRIGKLNVGAARTGNIGSARQGIAEADITRQGIEGLTDALGSLYSKGYDTAQDRAFKAFQDQFARDRASGQGLLGVSDRAFRAGAQLPNLQRQDISSLFSTGGLGRNRNQSLLDLDYQNFVGRYNLPFQNLQNVGNILSAMGPLAGGYGYAGALPADRLGGADSPLYQPANPGANFGDNPNNMITTTGILGASALPTSYGGRALNPSIFPSGITSLPIPDAGMDMSVMAPTAIYNPSQNNPPQTNVAGAFGGFYG